MIFRSAFILPVAVRDPADGLAAQLGIDQEALHNTLSVPLVPATELPEAEPTHFACCGVLTGPQRAALEQASGKFPGALWWRWAETGAGAGQLAASFDGTRLGEAWSWEKCLAAAGLQRRVRALPGR